jgi:hypothetical protein
MGSIPETPKAHMDIEMIEGGEGEAVPCVHIYAMPDGSFVIEQSEAQAPEGGESVASADLALEQAAQMLADPMKADNEAQAMTDAKAGYDRRARRDPFNAGPGAIFGE